jgi:hypothetical protein
MRVKLFEIRDRATFIPVFGIDPMPENEEQRYLLRRAGYSCSMSDRLIIVGYLQSGECHYSPYDWGGRTMPVAHKYIEKHWPKLQDGDVIDVEFILGETTTIKTSERNEVYE